MIFIEYTIIDGRKSRTICYDYQVLNVEQSFANIISLPRQNVGSEFEKGEDS